MINTLSQATYQHTAATAITEVAMFSHDCRRDYCHNVIHGLSHRLVPCVHAACMLYTLCTMFLRREDILSMLVKVEKLTMK